MPAPPRTVDAAERALRLKAGFWSLAGGIIGAAVGSWRFGPPGLFLGAPLGFGLVFLFSRALTGAAGKAFGAFLAPSGDSTPHQREYSQPQSLALRGRYEEAVKAYEGFCLEFPDEPEPYLRIARLYRDELQRYDDAIQWFKKARSHARLAQADEITVAQEIIEIHTLRLKQPTRAIPELARLAERFPAHPAAAWARQRMGRVTGQRPGRRSGPNLTLPTRHLLFPLPASRFPLPSSLFLPYPITCHTATQNGMVSSATM